MSKDKLAQVFHFDLYGKRESKYDFLNKNSLKSIEWNKLQPIKPNFFLVKKDFDQSGKYEKGFKVDELFIQNNTGLNTEFDELAIQENKNSADNVLEILKTKTDIETIKLLGLKQESLEKVRKAIIDVKNNNPKILKIKVRPFEDKFSIYTGKSNGIMGRPRHEIMKHFQNGENLGLISMRQYAYDVPYHCYTFVSKQIVTSRLFISNKGYCSIFPLYLYPETNAQQSIEKSSERTVNFNMTIIDKIEKDLNLYFVEDDNLVVDLAAGWDGTIYPTDILDYIYAVLHSPTYREKYKEFLKIDFPRVPYPKEKSTFEKLTSLGSQLRQIHLLESPIVEKYITQYPIDGSNIVTKPTFQNGKVFINDTQYFDNVPTSAWEFYIGGYQPAQKWLKDRKGRTLEYEDILHYQKIIVALTETQKIMTKISSINIEDNEPSK